MLSLVNVTTHGSKIFLQEHSQKICSQENKYTSAHYKFLIENFENNINAHQCNDQRGKHGNMLNLSPLVFKGL